MALPHRWQRAPRPNADAIRVIEQALEAAKRGHVRHVAIVVVNPLHEVESAVGGEPHTGYLHALVGGLQGAALKILHLLDAESP